jgi:lysophospholipid acyltransferase (LPLAT)-like uncharacterized protein
VTDTEARRARRARRDRWVARIGAWLLRLLAATWRLRYVNREPALALTAKGRSFVYCFWHGEQLSLLWAFRKTGTAILISEHGDGEIVARAAISLGYATVRGSSSRGADRALLQLSRELESGRDIAVTPDGPRGPRHSFAPGALIAAHRAGAPIIPLRSFASRAWRLRSWDQFEIPKPFARVTVVMGDPVYVEAPGAREAAAQTDRFTALLHALALPARG